MTTELLPLRFRLVATLVGGDEDRPENVVVRSHPHPHGCTCDRCLKLYGKAGRP